MTQMTYNFLPDVIKVVRVNSDLERLSQVLDNYLLHVNPLKSVAIPFGNKNVCSRIEITMSSGEISLVDRVRNWGLIMDDSFRYKEHI